MESKKIVDFIEALAMANIKKLEMLRMTRGLNRSETLEQDILIANARITTYITLLDEIRKYDTNLFKREEIDNLIERERKI